MERWLDIPEYSGLYQASSLGRIRRNQRILKPQTQKDGYCTISLSKEGIVKNYYIHILVAETFLGPISQGLQTNHKNGKKFDNSVENLEYVTQSINCLHAYEHGLMSRSGHKNCFHKLTEDNVKEIRREYRKKPDLITFAKKFKVHPDSIENVVKRITWKNI